MRPGTYIIDRLPYFHRIITLFTMKLTTVLTAACVCAGALAHMELIEPAAIDSKFAGTPVSKSIATLLTQMPTRTR